MAFAACSFSVTAAERMTVRPEATQEALINPGMGWVCYHYDNSNWNYGADTAPGEYDLCLSLGRPDGTPRIALPLKDQVGKTRRYRLGRITLEE